MDQSHVVIITQGKGEEVLGGIMSLATESATESTMELAIVHATELLTE